MVNSGSCPDKLKGKKKNKSLFYHNRTATGVRNYDVIAESTKRIYKNTLVEKMTPVFYKLLYDHILCRKACRENWLFYSGKDKFWRISEVKIAEKLGVSKATARKLLNRAEMAGIIKRRYLGDTHALAEAMGIALTEYGKSMLKAQFYTKKNTARSNSYQKDMNNIYKSNSGEIAFKANGDKITAKAVVSFQEITGMKQEKITKCKCKWIHQVLNTLSTAFHIQDIDSLLSAFRQFLKSQLAFLKKITFYTLFNLKAVMAYIWKTKATIKQQEATPTNYWERIEKMIDDYKAAQQEALHQSPTKQENVSHEAEKLPENKSFSSNTSPNVTVKNGLQSIGNLMSSFFKGIDKKE